MKSTPLSAHLLLATANNRHGIVLSPQEARLSKSDIDTITHVGVPYSLTHQWNSASGGVSFNPQQAHLAAIGESIERYCAAICEIDTLNINEVEKNQLIHADDCTLFSDAQRAQNDFSFLNLYSDTCGYASVYSLLDNTQHYVPQPLVVLRDDYNTKIPTSSGLAAGPTVQDALLRATQELIERDALMTTWMHSLAAKRIETPERLQQLATQVNGNTYTFDITPDYSPFPVIAVCGTVPERGIPRFSLGVACKETYEAAIEKAFLEWSQGIYFAGIYPKNNNIDHLFDVRNVHSFDDHAVFYTINHELVEKLPLLADTHKMHPIQELSRYESPQAALRKVTRQLHEHDIELFYRDLTTIDALQSGVRVVRVLSPQLVPIHADHQWPFLGGTAADVSMRYRDCTSVSFPNKYPHPLG